MKHRLVIGSVASYYKIKINTINNNIRIVRQSIPDPKSHTIRLPVFSFY